MAVELHDDAAEQAVLGAMMLDSSVIEPIIEIIRTANVFFRPRNAHLFGHIVGAWATDQPTEPIALARRIADLDELPAVGGGTYLHECVQAVPLVANAPYYAEIVTNLFERRQLTEVIARRVAMAAAIPDRSQRREAVAAVGEDLMALYEMAAPVRPSSARAAPLDWATFMTADLSHVDWLAGKLMVRGQQIALVGDGKAGKSLLAQEWAWRMAAGKAFLGDVARDPVRVLYVDQENTHEDIQERLASFGASADTLTNLVYLSFPPFRPLNASGGSAELLGAVKEHQADVVILDTISRMVDGKENDADPWRDLYRLTLLKLKALKVSSIRLDHFGKDRDRGARGNSAKTQDVDHVWELRPTDQGGDLLTLNRTYTRTGKGASEMLVRRHGTLLDGDRWETGGTRHALEAREADGSPAWAGEATKLISKQLDAAGTPWNMGRDRLRTVCANLGIRVGTETLKDVIAYRKAEHAKSQNLTQVRSTTDQALPGLDGEVRSS